MIFYATFRTNEHTIKTSTNKVIEPGEVRILEPVGGTSPWKTVFQSPKVFSEEKYPDNTFAIILAKREEDYEGKPSYNYSVLSTTTDFIQINEIVTKNNLTVVHGVEELIEDPV